MQALAARTPWSVILTATIELVADETEIRPRQPNVGGDWERNKVLTGSFLRPVEWLVKRGRVMNR